LSYVWATDSGRTYEKSRAMFSFGQSGVGITLGAAGISQMNLIHSSTNTELILIGLFRKTLRLGQMNRRRIS